MNTKICTKCKEEKPLSEYYKDKRRKSGMYSHCKACHYKMTHAYEQSERGKEVVRKSYLKNIDKRREYQRQLDSLPKSRKRRERYAKSEAGREAQRRKDEKRKQLHGYKIQAKATVAHAVARGDIPHISTQVCAECGVQAQEYHHESYAKEDWLRVTPLCKTCHAATYTTPYN